MLGNLYGITGLILATKMGWPDFLGNKKKLPSLLINKEVNKIWGNSYGITGLIG